jgi:hypothetical protein
VYGVSEKLLGQMRQNVYESIEINRMMNKEEDKDDISSTDNEDDKENLYEIGQ